MPKIFLPNHRFLYSQSAEKISANLPKSSCNSGNTGYNKVIRKTEVMLYEKV